MNIKKIFGFAIGPIGGAFLGFITLPLTAWFFNTEDIGRIALLQVIIGFSTMLFSFGLDQAYVREYHEKQNKSELWKQATYPGFILLIFISGFLLIEPFLLSELVFGISSTLISVLIILVCMSSYLIRFFSLILRMQENGLLYSMSQIWPKLFNIILLLNFILVFNDNDFIYLIYAQVISNLMACTIFGWNTRSVWLHSKPANLYIEEVIGLLKFGLPLVLSGLAFWGMNYIDRLFLKFFVNFEQLGIYSIVMSFAAVALVFQNIVSIIWSGIVYRWVKENKNTYKIEIVADFLITLIVLIFCLVGLLSSKILFLLPPQYDIVQYILLPAIMAPLMYTLSEITGIGIAVSKKTYLTIIVTVISLLIAVCMNYLLTKSMGATGAAISNCIAFFVFFILKTEISSKVWINIERFHIYCILLALLVIAISFAVFQSELKSFLNLICIIIFFLAMVRLFFKRKKIISIVR